MVKHSKKLEKRIMLIEKIKVENVLRPGKQVSKLGRHGRSGRRAGMRSVKSVIRKKGNKKCREEAMIIK